jgi:hypothetical protein
MDICCLIGPDPDSLDSIRSIFKTPQDASQALFSWMQENNIVVCGFKYRNENDTNDNPDYIAIDNDQSLIEDEGFFVPTLEYCRGMVNSGVMFKWYELGYAEFYFTCRSFETDFESDGMCKGLKDIQGF